jgi:hypothetical protein
MSLLDPPFFRGVAREGALTREAAESPPPQAQTTDAHEAAHRTRGAARAAVDARGGPERQARTDSVSTTKFAKLGRERKILIDYLRNNRTNTSIAAFSPRARAGATVSMLVDWDELGKTPERWTLLSVPRRLERLRADPSAGYWKIRQKISSAAFQAINRL